jgi:hypothetical protein
LAKDLVKKYFKAEGENASFDDYKGGDKVIPYRIDAEIKGSQLLGLHYYQLMPYVTNDDLEKTLSALSRQILLLPKMVPALCIPPLFLVRMTLGHVRKTTCHR